MLWINCCFILQVMKNSETILCCGYNPYIDYKLKEAVKVCAALDIEISRITAVLQSKYHLSDNPDSIKKSIPGSENNNTWQIEKTERVNRIKKED